MEYLRNKLITGGSQPQTAFLAYLKYLRKLGVDTQSMKVLDLGCGNGRNSIYLASLGNEVIGFEFSKNALKIAEKRTREANVLVKYINHNIGAPYPLEDNSIDLVIDVTASNSLSESKRMVYLEEVHRVLKPEGHFFVRALLKDGDKNAKNLLKISPGKEADTYFMKEIGITERVFAMSDFETLYGKYFDIKKVIRAVHCATVDQVVYKRRYIIAYMQKK